MENQKKKWELGVGARSVETICGSLHKVAKERATVLGHLVRGGNSGGEKRMGREAKMTQEVKSLELSLIQTLMARIRLSFAVAEEYL
jgi:hypothetical protein